METPTDCGTKRYPPPVMSTRLVWLLSKLPGGRLMMHLDCPLMIHGGLVEKAKGRGPLECRLFGPIRETAPDPLRTFDQPVMLAHVSHRNDHTNPARRGFPLRPDSNYRRSGRYQRRSGPCDRRLRFALDGPRYRWADQSHYY